MAQVTINIPDAQVNRLRTVVTEQFALETPATAAEFKAWVSSLIRAEVWKHELHKATEVAKQSVAELDVT
jgi:hypothetical protein